MFGTESALLDLVTQRAPTDLRHSAPSNDEDVVESPRFGYRSVLLFQLSDFHYGLEDSRPLQGTFQHAGAQHPSVISLAR